MPSLSEVARLVERALDDARRAVAALALVEESAGQAVVLLVGVGVGAEALEADFAEVASLWRSVVSGSVRLRELLVDGIEQGERVLVALAEHLIAAGVVRRGVPTVAMHVEVKVAWRLRERGGLRAEVVINNLVCDGPLSCRRLAAVILGVGQELVVHDPAGTHVFRGRSSR